ncbi:MAG: VOC family protein, partial [Hyphomicrobiales bacterium]
MKKLEGIHHISAITADATKNLLFYSGVMGLRLVKKTVNQDNPAVYHLFYADEDGSPGADLTFFEYPGLVRGRSGAGMIHRIAMRVGSLEALEFWGRRLAAAGLESTIEDGRLSFEDPEG